MFGRLSTGQRTILPASGYGISAGPVHQVLDSSVNGVTLVRHFYAAYNHYPGLEQRVLGSSAERAIRDLKGLHPEDAGLAQWA